MPVERGSEALETMTPSISSTEVQMLRRHSHMVQRNFSYTWEIHFPLNAQIWMFPPPTCCGKWMQRATNVSRLFLATLQCNGDGLRTCDGVGEVLVAGFPQQPDQRRNSITVLNGNFVVGIFAVRNVLQCPRS